MRASSLYAGINNNNLDALCDTPVDYRRVAGESKAVESVEGCTRQKSSDGNFYWIFGQQIYWNRDIRRGDVINTPLQRGVGAPVATREPLQRFCGPRYWGKRSRNR